MHTNRLWIYVILLLFLLPTLNGCHDYNPNLHGKWQLLTITTPTQTLIRDSIFYNFDNYTFDIQNLSRVSYPGGDVLGEFHQVGDSLILDVVDNWYNIPTSYHFNGMEKRVKIIDISSSRLRLSAADGIYTFRSYN